MRWWGQLQTILPNIVHEARLAFIDGHSCGGVATDDVDPPFLNLCLTDGLVQLGSDVMEGNACGAKEGRKEEGKEGCG